jgi:hypothetical protein
MPGIYTYVINGCDTEQTTTKTQLMTMAMCGLFLDYNQYSLSYIRTPDQTL